MSSAFAVLIIRPLAFGVGFATQRGNVCSVLAARQIAETGKATRLVAFLTSSLWALVIVVPLGWLTAGAIGLSPTHEDLGLAVSGGALYGLGTFINGACGFGTAARVFSGTMLGVQITLAVSVKRWKDRKVQWGEVTVRRIAALTDRHGTGLARHADLKADPARGLKVADPTIS